MNVHHRFVKPFLMAGLALLSASCGPGHFGPDDPFGVIAERYRYLPDAEHAQQQLKDMGIGTDLMGYEIRGEGRWFGVFLGGSSSLEGMDEMKMNFEDEHALEGLQRINYNQIAPSSFKIPDAPEETDVEDLKLPGCLPELFQALPYIPNMQLASMQIFRTADSINVFSLRSPKDEPIAYPRNIGAEMIENVSLGLVNATYKNHFFGKGLSFTAVKLNKSHGLGEKPTDYLAERIVGVKQEEMEQVERLTANGVESCIVTINPRADKVRYFLLLFNPQNNILIIGESTAKSFDLEEWRALAQKMNGKSISEYWHVGNVLSVVNKKPSAQSLVYASFNIIDETKGTWADRLKGNRRVNFAFYEKKRVWKCEATQFGHHADAKALYEQMNKVKYRVQPDSIQAAGVPARLFYEKATVVVNKKKQYQQRPYRLEFLAESSIVAMNIPAYVDSVSQIKRMAEQLVWKSEE